MWALFVHSEVDILDRSDADEDQSESKRSSRDGVNHISSSFLARCEDIHAESPHSLAAALAATAQHKFKATLSDSLLKDETNRDSMVPFESREIKLGKLLGSGQFSQVYEIESFRLGSEPPESASATDVERRLYMNGRTRYRNTKKCTYALKHLRPTLPQAYKPSQYAQFASDLVQEAEFLAVLQHPNIIKLRGVSHLDASGFHQGPKGYFLLIDRLDETLDMRITAWKKRRKRLSLDFLQSIKNRASICNSGTLLAQKLEILLQVSAAMMFLHDKRVIFRDLKPAHIGFDVRGDVKLFDFGLAKILPTTGNAHDDTYKLSMAGTPRYMAPECLSRSKAGYNLKADVYSFGLLMSEVLSLETPYSQIKSQRALIDFVLKDGGRPKISPYWPISIIELLEASFGQSSQRPTMTSIFKIIRLELCHARKGDDSGLEDSVIFRRRSAASVESEPHVHRKRTKSDVVKMGKLLRSSLNSTFSRKVSV